MKYKFDYFNIFEKVVIGFFVVMCLVLLLFIVRNVYKKTGTERHKRILLENVDRLNISKEHSDTINGVYFLRLNDSTISNDDRDTTVSFNLKDSYYHCVFWDYRGDYYKNSSIVQQFFWHDFIVNGSLHSNNTLDSIIVIKLRLKIVKEYKLNFKK